MPFLSSCRYGTQTEDSCIYAVKAKTEANRDYNYDRDNILYIRRLDRVVKVSSQPGSKTDSLRVTGV